MNQVPPPTDWTPGLIVLAVGFVAGILFLLLSRRGEGAASGSPDDLDAKYQSLLAELKEHVANKHLLPAAQWEKNKRRLEQAAAQVLKDRDQHKHEALKAEARAEKRAQTPAAPAQGGFFAQNPTIKGALLGGAVVGFFVLLGSLLGQETKPRADGMGMTGAGPMMGGGAPMADEPQAQDPELEALLARVQRAPDDGDALAAVASFLIRRQGFDDARPFVQRLTLVDPFHVGGRVARAVLLAVDGHSPEAQNELERLGARYVDAYDARMYAGLLAMEANDPGRALKQLELFTEQAPASQVPPYVPQIIGQLRSELAGGGMKSPH
jgi:hypothetical protein